MLLSADPGDQGGHARAPGIPPADRPPAADVRRVGVRLPDRDRTVRPFGNRDELLGEYAWYSDNSARQTHPVGRLKPNAFGLFDMLGNALEWCHESSPHHRDTPGRDVEDPSPVDGGVNRFLRGGAYIHRADGVRADTGHPIGPKTSLGRRRLPGGAHDPSGSLTRESAAQETAVASVRKGLQTSRDCRHTGSELQTVGQLGAFRLCEVVRSCR